MRRPRNRQLVRPPGGGVHLGYDVEEPAKPRVGSGTSRKKPICSPATILIELRVGPLIQVSTSCAVVELPGT